MDSEDLPLGHETSSKTNLIDVQHVGVTAKPRDMKRALPEYSSGETDGAADIFNKASKKTYIKLTGGDDTETTTTPPLSATSATAESSKLLYEMHAETQQPPTRQGGARSKAATRRARNSATAAFSRIEFQLYNKPSKRATKKQQCRCHQRARPGKKASAAAAAASLEKRGAAKRPPFFERLRMSLKEMCAARAPILSQSSYPTGTTTTSPSFSRPSTVPTQAGSGPPQQPKDACGCVYTFDHGCPEFFRVADCPPQLLSNVLAERATYFATRFWAEFFGGLHIGVSFVITFFLQTYRFLLYSLINTFLVGMLQMTSDYLLKPMLAVAFNGFLQPPLVFLYNILSSIKDILEPVSEALNNFMKPLATVGRSIRLVEASYNKKKFVKDV